MSRTPVWTASPTSRPARSTSGSPRSSKAPEGHTYAWTENPLGINGYYLVSKGEKTPYRPEAALGLVQQHPGAHRAAAGRRSSRTWWRCWCWTCRRRPPTSPSW
ncbi:NADH-quinone oxidoreductase subunit D-related protein [Streptomyces aurantiogriseus]